jgi:hypothetical protein
MNASQLTKSGVGSGLLFAKTYGAQKIYCIKQNAAECVDVPDDADADQSAREHETLVSTIAAESESLEKLRRKVTLQHQLKTHAEKESQLMEKIRAMHKQIGTLQSNNADQGPFADMGDELRATFDRVSNEFTKRRRIANDLLGFVSETADMNRREVIEELGLESVTSTLNVQQSTMSPSRGC